MNRNQLRIGLLLATSIYLLLVGVNLVYNAGHTYDLTFRVLTAMQNPNFQWHTTITTTQGDTFTFQGSLVFMQGRIYHVIAMSKPVMFGLSTRLFIQEWWLLSAPFAPVELI